MRELFRHIDTRGEFSRIFREEDFIKEKFDFTGIKNVYLSNNCYHFLNHQLYITKN